MEATVRPPTWKTLLAFAIIYFVWGSTFLAIRVGVREVPPLVLASMRFFIAGVVLYGCCASKVPRLRRGATGLPRRFSQSASSCVDYGLLFWPNNACLRESPPSCSRPSPSLWRFRKSSFAYAAAHLPAGAGSSCRHRRSSRPCEPLGRIGRSPHWIAAEPSRCSSPPSVGRLPRP